MQVRPVNGPEECAQWRAVYWRQINRRVCNLRRRIFRATRENDHRKVKSLQKLMLRSRANAVKSVRQVTQINEGKLTPGVDKLIVKTTEARSQLIERVLSHQPWRAQYWERRNTKRHAELSGKQRALAKRQKGECFWCGETVHNDEYLHVHHVESRRLGGSDALFNLRLMHLYCHQQLHAREKSDREREAVRLSRVL